MKIAIIGSGAAAFAAVHAARRASASCRIDVIEPAASPPEPPLAGKDHRLWTRQDFAQLHAEIRQASGLRFPPPKTHFGRPIERHAGRRKTVWRSAEPGGLTNHWSASVFPYTDAELSGWATDRRTLDPFYRVVASIVGIAGAADSLDEYFGENFATQPPAPLIPLGRKMIEDINSGPPAAEFKLIAGVNRLAIDTRPGSQQSCVACGGCFYGCYRQAIFNARMRLAADATAMSIRFLPCQVSRIASDRDGSWSIVGDTDVHSGYDKVFCAAGCVGSSEIILRSFGHSGMSQPLLDNDLYFFPIFYFGTALKADQDQYLAIANLVVGFVPTTTRHRYAELHIAPVPDYLLGYYFPSFAHDHARALSRRLRGRMLLGKLYLHSDYAGRHALRVDPQGVWIEGDSKNRSQLAAKAALTALRHHLSPKEFLVVTQPRMRSSTSSHYAGTLHSLLEGGHALRTGAIAPGVHVIDSSVFPTSPAPPPTFTIMANAYRVVTETMNG